MADFAMARSSGCLPLIPKLSVLVYVKAILSLSTMLMVFISLLNDLQRKADVPSRSKILPVIILSFSRFFLKLI